MNLQRDVRRGLQIGRAEIVRSYRQLRQNRRRFVGLSVVVLFLSGYFLLMLPNVYSISQTSRSIASIPHFGFTATVLPVFVLSLMTLRTAQRFGTIEAEELVLMSIHPRAVVIGFLVSEIAQLTLWLGLPLGIVVATFGAGLGAPTLVVTAGLVCVPLLCWAAVWGYALGIGVLRLLRWLSSRRFLLNVVGLLAIIPLLVGVQIVVERAFSIEALLAGVTFEPLAEYVAIAFAGTDLAQPLTLGGGAVLGFFMVLTPIGLVFATHQATVYWFTDNTSVAASRTGQVVSGGFSAPPPFRWTVTGHITWGHLLQAIRRPQEIGHVLNFLIPLALLLGVFLPSASNQLGIFLAGFSVFLGTYLSGIAFALNPLGDDRPQFPLLSLTHATPKMLVRSRVFAGVAVGVSVTILGLLAAFLLGASLLVVLVLVVVGGIFCFGSAMFSVGIGATQPVYETQEYWGMETIVPSTVSILVWIYIVGDGTIIGIVVVLLLVTERLLFTPLIGIGLIAYGLVTIGVPYWLYRYAVRQVEKVTIE